MEWGIGLRKLPSPRFSWAAEGSVLTPTTPPTPKQPLSRWQMCCFIISSGSCCSRTAQEGCGCGRNNRASGGELMGSQFGGAGPQDGGNGALGLALTVLVPALISRVNCKLVCSPGGIPPPQEISKMPTTKNVEREGMASMGLQRAVDFISPGNGETG